MGYISFDKTQLKSLEYTLNKEFLQTNDLGSYTSSSIIFSNTRKYHGLLVCPMPELDGERHVLLSSLDESIIQDGKVLNLATHKYPKGV